MLTNEEVLNGLEFRAVSKILKQKYPFVKKVKLADSDVNSYESLIFLELVLNPYEFAEYFDGELENFVIKSIGRGEIFQSSYPSVFLKDKAYEELKDFDDELDDLLINIHRSPALPSDVKLPGNKRFAVSSFTTDPNTKIRDEKKL